MNEQQKAIAEFLSAENITFEARYMGETVRDNDWQCDSWRVSLASAKNRMETDYYTGLGHRKTVKGAERVEGASYPKNSVGYKAWAKQCVKQVTPHSADVLYSLLMDSSSADMSFDGWCDDYGFDNDSIKVLNMYQACCKTAKDLCRVFTHSQIETLRTLLEDY